MNSINTTPPTARRDPYAALRFRDFRFLLIGKVIAILGEQMVGVAVGWELYVRTQSALALGLIGLVQIVPVLLLSLPAGHVADRYDRRRVMLATETLLALCSLLLAVLSVLQGPLVLIYGVLLLIGIARAFNNPASSALLPQTVAPEAFSNAATWRSSGFQIAAVVGPALGGALIAWQRSASLVYAVNVVMALTYVGFIVLLRTRPVTRSTEPTTFRTVAAGVRFVWHSKILLAAITLDLFAVLLGGATTLLPIFAEDILHVGPSGLGWLRAAPAVGALTMGLAIAYLPPWKQAGKTLLWAVIGFGLATIVFGLSRSFGLSLVMLALLGALDNISVVIRHTLELIATPDEMRGRVSAVNSIFIGASNELGGFESGLAAAIFGPIAAVVGGGIGTILVVAVVAWVWPQIRQLGALTEHHGGTEARREELSMKS